MSLKCKENRHSNHLGRKLRDNEIQPTRIKLRTLKKEAVKGVVPNILKTKKK